MPRLLLAVVLLLPLSAAEILSLPRAGGPLRIAIADDEVEVAAAGVRRAVRMAPGAAAKAGRDAEAVGWLLDLGRDTRVVITRRVQAQLPAGADPAALCAAHGLRLIERHAWDPRFFLAEAMADDPLAGVRAAAALAATTGLWVEPEFRLRLARLAEPDDPLYPTQWHLRNTGGNVAGGVAGVDIGIGAWWATTAAPPTGAGINVAVVDDGLDLVHPDLAAGVRTDIDIDVYDGDGDPSHIDPVADGHGTVVAGLIGARRDGAGSVGVAYGASLVGVRMLGPSGSTSFAVASQALGHRATALVDPIHVSNNSWGPVRNGVGLGSTTAAIEAALTAGTTHGRLGRGTIFVFAAGNDRAVDDTADYNAFASHRRAIGVAALGPAGDVTDYSERGVGLLLSAPGGISGAAMVSTDWTGDAGFQDGDHTEQTPPTGSTLATGTSFAAPLVAGAAALMLEQYPQLSWRDVPHLLARSAVPLGGDANAAGLRFTDDLGAGRLHVPQALAEAATWTPLPPEISVSAAADPASLSIPDDDPAGVSKTITISAAAGFTVERAALTVNLVHPRRGNIEFELVSPSGTRAIIARRPGDNTANLDNWTFTSVRTMGEAGAGTWTVIARDLAAGNAGTLGACTLTLHGYVPYSAPTLTAVFPSAVLATQPDTVVAVGGSGLAVTQGGDVLGTLTAGAASVAVERDAAGWASATIPAAVFAAVPGPYPSTLTVTLTNPTVRGIGYAPAGGGADSRTITVRDTNTAPVLVASTDANVTAGATTTTGSATWTDPNGDVLRHRLGTAPGKGTASVHPVTGVISYRPDPSASGTDTLTVVATDGIADGVPATITYTIIPGGGSGGGSGSGGGGGGGCGAGAGLATGLVVLLIAGLRRRRH